MEFAEILTKHWAYQSSYCELIQPVFHHSGNTPVLFVDDNLDKILLLKREQYLEFKWGVRKGHLYQCQKEEDRQRAHAAQPTQS